MAPLANSQDVGESYQQTRSRFDDPSVAAVYATRHGGHSRDRREQACIERALERLPAGSKILDLPCGAGRLAPMLARKGFEVTEADNSPFMVEQAKQAWKITCESAPEMASRVMFEVRDMMSTGYPDALFDAIICNRLMHHFVEPQTRIAAFRELRRISKGIVVVSFFNTFAVDALTFKVKNFIRRKVPNDRIPIPMKQFLTDAAGAGLVLDQTYPTRWGISPQWYVRLRVS